MSIYVSKKYTWDLFVTITWLCGLVKKDFGDGHLDPNFDRLWAIQ